MAGFQNGRYAVGDGTGGEVNAMEYAFMEAVDEMFRKRQVFDETRGFKDVQYHVLIHPDLAKELIRAGLVIDHQIQAGGVKLNVLEDSAINQIIGEDGNAHTDVWMVEKE